MNEIEKKLIDALPEFENPLSLFEILEKDLEKLQAQQRSLEKSTPKNKFLRKVVSKRSSKNAPIEELDLTGSRLSTLSSLRGGDHFVGELQDNPFNSKARLGLVELFLRKSEGASLLLCRDAFLLAMLEVEQKEVSTNSMQTALLAQKQYLESLAVHLKHKGEDAIKNSEKKDPNTKTSDDSHKVELYKISRQKWYIQELVKLLKYKTLEANKSIDLDQLAESSKFRKEDIANPFPSMLESASGLPLAKTVRQRMLTMLDRVAKKIAIGGYYESVLYRKRATQLMLSYVAGNSEVVDSIKRLMQNASVSISVSLKKLHGPMSPHEQIICLREYALVNMTIYQYFPQMGVALVADDIQRMENAYQLLNNIKGEKGIPQLQNKLLKGIKEIKGHNKPQASSSQEEVTTEENVTESTEQKTQPSAQKNDGPRKSRKGFFEGEVPQDADIKAKKTTDKVQPSFFKHEVPKDFGR